MSGRAVTIDGESILITPTGVRALRHLAAAARAEVNVDWSEIHPASRARLEDQGLLVGRLAMIRNLPTKVAVLTFAGAKAALQIEAAS